MTKKVKKTWYVIPKKSRMVERLAFQLKVPESHIIESMMEIHDEKMWKQILKIKYEK